MEILGLLDALESMVLDGFKIPLTKKTMIIEDQILSVIDKMRMVVQGGGDFAKKALGDKTERKPDESQAAAQQVQAVTAGPVPENVKAAEIVQQAYQIAKEVRGGADKYADEVLSNLELTSTRILRTVKAGRDRLGATVQGKVEEESLSEASK